MRLSQVLRQIKNVLRNLFARETLGEAPELRDSTAPRRQFAAMLLRGEALPVDAEAAHPRRGAGALRVLFAPEVLPEDPPGPPRAIRPGLLRALFVPEPIVDLPAAPGKPVRSAWLRWLFRFERLDPPP